MPTTTFAEFKSVTAEDEVLIQKYRKNTLHVNWDPLHGVWSSPNAKEVWSPVPEKNPIYKVQGIPWRPQTGRWFCGVAPWLAFWPSRPQFHGIFASLNLIKNRLPAVRTLPTGGRYEYYVYPKLVAEWRLLEDRLLLIGTTIIRRHIPETHWCKAMKWPSVQIPSDFGYDEKVYSEESITYCLYQARNAFVGLTAYVSFAIALDLAHNPTIKGTAPSWLIYTQRSLGIDPDWLNELHQSFVCNFNHGFRLAGFLGGDMVMNFPVEPFAAFQAVGPPLFIHWGFTKIWDHDWKMKLWAYHPSRAEVKAAIVAYNSRLPLAERLSNNQIREHLKRWEPKRFKDDDPVDDDDPLVLQDLSNEGPSYEATTNVRDSPESPPPGARGEEVVDELDPHEFGLDSHLKHMADLRSLMISRESAEEGSKRRAEEAKAEEAKVDVQSEEPGVGDTLYVWSTHGSKLFTRRMVPVAEWKDLWLAYQPEERHYCVAYSEWNLLENDTPTHFPYDIYAAALEDSEDEESGERRRKKPRRHSSSSGDGRDRLPRPVPNLEHLKQQPFQQGDLSHYSVPISSRETPDARSVVHDKYRFTITEPYRVDDRIQAVAHPPCEDGEILTGFAPAEPVLKWLGLWTAKRTNDTTQAIWDFYYYIVRSPTVQLFSPLWDDLAPHRHRLIIEHPVFKYRRLASDCHIIGVVGNRRLVDQWFLLLLHDARVVVEVLFQPELNSIRKIIGYLAAQGIPFATVKAVRTLPRGCLYHPIDRSLGYRFAGDIFNRLDYKRYQEKKAKVLDDAVGRAAIRRGGLIWRLSVDFVNIKKRVVSGPTSSVAWKGEKVGETLDGYILVDDCISGEDLDTIVGLYKTYTGTYDIFGFEINN